MASTWLPLCHLQWDAHWVIPSVILFSPVSSIYHLAATPKLRLGPRTFLTSSHQLLLVKRVARSAVFTTSVKASRSWNASKPAQIRRSPRTLQAWNSAARPKNSCTKRNIFIWYLMLSQNSVFCKLVWKELNWLFVPWNPWQFDEGKKHLRII